MSGQQGWSRSSAASYPTRPHLSRVIPAVCGFKSRQVVSHKIPFIFFPVLVGCQKWHGNRDPKIESNDWWRIQLLYPLIFNVAMLENPPYLLWWFSKFCQFKKGIFQLAMVIMTEGKVDVLPQEFFPTGSFFQALVVHSSQKMQSRCLATWFGQDGTGWDSFDMGFNENLDLELPYVPRN